MSIIIFGKKNKTFGFTLLEVMIALVIMSLALSSLIVSMSTNSRNLAHLKELTSAEWVAANVISKARLKLIDLGSSQSYQEGTELMFNKDYRYVAYKVPTDNEYVSKIIVSVYPGNADQPLTTVTGYLSNEPEQNASK